MSRLGWLRWSTVACAVVVGCDEGPRSAQSTLGQTSYEGGAFDPWTAVDEGTGEPIALRPLDDDDYIVHGPDTAVPFPPSDGGVIDNSPPDSPPATGPDPNAPNPGSPPPSTPDAGMPAPDASVSEPPDAGGGIDLGLCNLLESLLCAEGLECVNGYCTEPLACAADDDCDVACSQPSRCAASCEDANKCKVDCGQATRCNVSCVGANNCEPRCRDGGDCEIDCREANNCDHVVCEGNAQCVVHCGEDTNCKFERCREPRRCSGDIIVCNRECPPGSEEVED